MEILEAHRLVDVVGQPADGLDRDALRAALVEARRLRGWVDAQHARLTRRLTEISPNPLGDVATAAKSTSNEAAKAIDRAGTTGDVPAFAVALSNGDISASHVEILGNALRGVTPDQRQSLKDSGDELAKLASDTTADEFARLMRNRVRQMQQSDGMDELARQRKANRLKTWIDPDTGMGRFAGALDPVSFVKFNQLISELLRARVASGVDGPDDGPIDLRERHAWLQAMALMDLVNGKTSRNGRGPEVTIVVDTRVTDQAGRPTVDWGMPVDIPRQVLIDLINGTPADSPAGSSDEPDSSGSAGDGGSGSPRGGRAAAWEQPPATIVPVILNGCTVLHAPGRLDRYREVRSATREQRRVLRALYPTCAIPGCKASFSRTDIHHIAEWWANGMTNLDNLLPLCPYHHHKVHDEGWKLKLHPDRTLEITFPDGSQMSTGPPARSA